MMTLPKLPAAPKTRAAAAAPGRPPRNGTNEIATPPIRNPAHAASAGRRSPVILAAVSIPPSEPAPKHAISEP